MNSFVNLSTGIGDGIEDRHIADIAIIAGKLIVNGHYDHAPGYLSLANQVVADDAGVDTPVIKYGACIGADSLIAENDAIGFARGISRRRINPHIHVFSGHRRIEGSVIGCAVRVTARLIKSAVVRSSQRHGGEDCLCCHRKRKQENA